MKDCYIKKDSDFKKVYSAKKISSDKFLTLYTKKNSFNYSRIGITTTKKIGKAVIRNFVKRRLKSIYRNNYNKILKGYDYVFVVKKDACNIDYKLLERSFLNVLKRQKKVKI